jgi:hypothetical protein
MFCANSNEYGNIENTHNALKKYWRNELIGNFKERKINKKFSFCVIIIAAIIDHDSADF